MMSRTAKTARPTGGNCAPNGGKVRAQRGVYSRLTGCLSLWEIGSLQPLQSLHPLGGRDRGNAHARGLAFAAARCAEGEATNTPPARPLFSPLFLRDSARGFAPAFPPTFARSFHRSFHRDFHRGFRPKYHRKYHRTFSRSIEAHSGQTPPASWEKPQRKPENREENRGTLEGSHKEIDTRGQLSLSARVGLSSVRAGLCGLRTSLRRGGPVQVNRQSENQRRAYTEPSPLCGTGNGRPSRGTRAPRSCSSWPLCPESGQPLSPLPV